MSENVVSEGRFSDFSDSWVADLSDKELAKEINRKSEWDPVLLRELFYRADMLDVWDSLEEPDERIISKAGKVIGVRIVL